MKRILLACIAMLVVLALSLPAEAKKKKAKPKKPRQVVSQLVKLDPTREVVYVRYELLNLFWGTSIEPTLQPGIYGVTPYAGLNAWIAHKVATACSPCELPPQAKSKYCNHWIEDQLADEKRRFFRIPPEGWCFPMKPKVE